MASHTHPFVTKPRNARIFKGAVEDLMLLRLQFDRVNDCLSLARLQPPLAAFVCSKNNYVTHLQEINSIVLLLLPPPLLKAIKCNKMLRTGVL